MDGKVEEQWLVEPVDALYAYTSQEFNAPGSDNVRTVTIKCIVDWRTLGDKSIDGSHMHGKAVPLIVARLVRKLDRQSHTK